MPYKVPQYYFETLEKRLLSIPHAHGAGNRETLRRNFIYTFAGVTCAALAAFLIFLPDLSRKDIKNVTTQTESVAEEEQIEEFLIDSGISIYQLADSQYQQ